MVSKGFMQSNEQKHKITPNHKKQRTLRETAENYKNNVEDSAG